MKKADPRTLRPLNTPRPLRIRTGKGGRPLILYLGGRPRRVLQILDLWQIDDEWWRQPISRRYAILALEDGRTVTVFRDLMESRWYIQEG